MCWTARGGGYRPSRGGLRRSGDRRRGARGRRHRRADRPDAAVAAPTACTRRWPSWTRDGRHDVVVNLQGDLPTHPAGHLRAVLTPLADPACRHRARWWRRSTSEEEAALTSVVKAACAFDRGHAVSPGAVFLARADPLGRRPALAPYRHLRLPPRRAGRFVALPRSAAGTAREASNSCARWRPACASPARAWNTRRSASTRRTIWNARAACLAPAARHA